MESLPWDYKKKMAIRFIQVYVSGILLGAVVGGVTALLVTPKSGKEFRNQANEALRKAKIRMQEKARHATEQAKDNVNKAADSTSETLSGLKEEADQI